MHNPYDSPKSRVESDDAAPSFLAAQPKSRLFQWLVGMSIPLYFLYFFLPDALINTSQEMADIRGLSAYGSLVPMSRVVTWVLFPLWIMSAVGLFFFQAWGRILFASLYAFTLLLRLFDGAHVLSPVEAFLSELITLTDGAILILAFTSPLDAVFRQKRSR